MRRFLLALLGAFAAAGCGGGASSVEAPRGVLLISIDTLRRDHLGAYGSSPTLTPELDRLAAQSVVFDDAFSVAPITLPAHTSLLTGLYPSAHGVRDNGAARVPAEALTLAEILGAAGFHTRAVVAAFVLNACFGLDQGFEVYSAPTRGLRSIDLHVQESRADAVVDQGLAALSELAAEPAPFFVFLHFYDPHFPYAAPGISAEQPVPEQYAAEVRYVDRELGRLFAGLRELGIEDELTLLVTSDHGEGLEDGREKTHGYFLYDQTMRVPLLLKHPGLAPARVSGPVSLVDVAPTLLELLDLPLPPAGFDGRSLVAAARSGAADPARVLPLETYLPLISHGWAPYQGAVSAELKRIRSKTVELYDRRRDSAELQNLAGSDDREAALAAEAERLFHDATRRLARERVELDSADRARLEALGYAGYAHAVDDLAVDFATLADPRERYPLMQRLWSTLPLIEEGRASEALLILRELAQQDPANAEIALSLAKVTLDSPTVPLERAAEAEHALARALAARPLDAEIPWLLARVAKRRADDARSRMDAAQAANDATAGRAAASLWRAEIGRFHGELRRVLRLEPDHVRALAVLPAALIEDAEASRATGQADLARAQLTEALAHLERLLAVLTPAEDEERARYAALRDRAAAQLATLR